MQASFPNYVSDFVSESEIKKKKLSKLKRYKKRV